MTSDRLRRMIHDAQSSQEAGRLDDAVGAYRRLLKAAPKFAAAHHNLGVVFEGLGRFAEAAGSYRKALSLEPSAADTYSNLGNALFGLGDLEAALLAHRRAIELDPDCATAHTNLGNVLKGLGKVDEAARAHAQAIALDPLDGKAYCNIGVLLADQRKYQSAAAALRRAVELAPALVPAYENLAKVLAELGHFNDALEAGSRAVELAPRSASALSSQGLALRHLDRIDEAIDRYHQAIACDRTYAEGHNGLGVALARAGRLDAAMASFSQAYQLAPADAGIVNNFGICHLRCRNSQADWAFGLAAIEGRFEVDIDRRILPHPHWQGESLAGRRIIVWGEQGIGDELVYFGLVPELVGQGAQVVIECDPRLVPALTRSLAGVEVVGRPSPRAEATDIDCQVAAGSLVRWLRPDLAVQPAFPCYLKPDDGLTADLRRAYGAGPLVGIAWGGRQSGIPLAALAPALAGLPGQLVSLQYGEHAAEIAASGLDLLVDDSFDQRQDFERFIAQVAAMDLVISIDNTTVSVAAMMGQPAWDLLTVAPDWRMGLVGAHHPWHPSLRLFRQRTFGDWGPVVADVAAAAGTWGIRRA